MSEELDQEQYNIIIQSDYSIKIIKISKDLSRPELKRTTAGLQHCGIYTISKFSRIFKELYKSSLTNDNNLDNSYPFSSYLDKNTINDIDFTNVNNDIPINQTLLPILVDNSIGINYSDHLYPTNNDEKEIEKIKYPLVKPRLTRQNNMNH